MVASSKGAGTDGLEDLLTHVEIEIARYMMDGMQNLDIAARMRRSVHTVKTHKNSIRDKLQCTTMREVYQRLKGFLSRPAPSSPADRALAGLWLSRFSYESHIAGSFPARFRPGVQINVEEITIGAAPFTHAGRNVLGVRKHGGEPYEHKLSFLLKDRMVIGIWDNENSANAGCFQLAVDARGRAMAGTHLGNTSNLVVKTGDWVWLKLDSLATLPEGCSIRSFEELDRLITRVLEEGGDVKMGQILH